MTSTEAITFALISAYGTEVARSIIMHANLLRSHRTDEEATLETRLAVELAKEITRPLPKDETPLDDPVD